MRRIAGLVLLALMLAACGVSAEEAKFNEDMAKVRDIIETAYEDDMRPLTDQERAVAMALVGVGSGHDDYEIGTSENDKHFSHFMLVMSYTTFSYGGDAEFLTYLDETK